MYKDCKELALPYQKEMWETRKNHPLLIFRYDSQALPERKPSSLRNRRL